MFCSKTISKQKIQHNDKKSERREESQKTSVIHETAFFGRVKLSSGEGMQKKKISRVLK